MKKQLFLLALLAGWSMALFGQQAIPVGSGSYAEYTPLSKCKSYNSDGSEAHKGDQSRIMETRRIYISDAKVGEPIPTNDWWTHLLVEPYSGVLWTYPQVVEANGSGFYVGALSHWENTGREMKWDTKLSVSARRFHPAEAIADDWSDWGLRMTLSDDAGSMAVTMAQGVPFTWVESDDLELLLSAPDAELSQELPAVTDRLLVKMENTSGKDDLYAIYAPKGTTFSEADDEQIAVSFANGAKRYLSIAVLPNEEAFDAYAAYAPVIVRDTKVDWNYDETTALVTTTFTASTENLNGEAGSDLLQGFLPHHYNAAYAKQSIAFTNYTYDTPRGLMKMAAGKTFEVGYHFSGILPYFAAPELNAALANPYQYDRMKQLISEYASAGGFIADTYWGGKGLTQMALYMTFAKEMGEEELFEQCRRRLREVMEDWLTYTPGETNYFFARYDRWGALVGYETSFDSDTFNDHHFHYGYCTYAGALLALLDDDFRAKYGEMLKLVAKDFANWDRSDTRFPLFRTFTPWSGHSYAGGLGNAGNGNGQESTSEAMQGWGGVYLLGVALGDKQMRDAGIYGWITESHGTDEYWFDIYGTNINQIYKDYRDDAITYERAWSSNLTAAGIGWWTWFSGDPVWMHGIQWMPISPCLDYLSRDLDFVKEDYYRMWGCKHIGGWYTPNADNKSLGMDNGIGNVVLSYMQRFDADSAAYHFDRMWDENLATARTTDTNGISYYVIHSHRTYGDRDFSYHADIPTSSVYEDKDGKITYVVYNPESSERTVRFYKDGSQVISFKVPGNKLTAYSEDPVPTSVEIATPQVKTVEPGKTLQLSAKVFDQYGASVEGQTITWSVDGNAATISAAGLFTAGDANAESVTVRAASGDLEDVITLRINAAPVLTTAEITPSLQYIMSTDEVEFSFTALDQYGDEMNVSRSWTIEKDGAVVKNDSVFDLASSGLYTVKVVAAGNTYSQQFCAVPGMDNLALNKDVTASSYENAGSLAQNATDGDVSTRWSSEHSDVQWIYVDLGKQVYINDVTVLWEAAYASQYTVQVSNDAQVWTDVADVSCSGGTVSTSMAVTARYVRLDCKVRATVYGYSLYELQVHGIDPDADASALMGIEISADEYLVKEGSSVQLTATGYNGKGQVVDITPVWSVDAANGTITADGLFTAAGYGIVEVTAAADGKTATAQFVVEETIKPLSVSISPSVAQVVQGESLTFELSAMDQFNAACSTEGFSLSCTENAALISGNTFNAAAAGTYTIVASNGTISATATVTVGSYSAVNLALGKDVYASSYENDETVPQNVNDGDLTSRWGSSFEDNQYIMVDLGAEYILSSVVLNWNAEAYATAYRVQVSYDENVWTTVASVGASSGGKMTHVLENAGGRYVRIYCISRSSQYGSCINEIEVYGTAKRENPVITTVEIDAEDGMSVTVGEPVSLKAAVYDQYGLEFVPAPTVAWAVSNDNASIDQNGLLTPLVPGVVVVWAVSSNVSDQLELVVKPASELSGLVLSPAAAEIEIGSSLKLSVSGIDQFGNVVSVKDVEWTGAVDGLFSGTATGTYTVTASCEGYSATASITVVAKSDNLALNKAISSINTASTNAKDANDGNAGTRWIAASTTAGEGLVIDLDGYYYLTSSVISWEAASATAYDIFVSFDNQNWSQAYSISGYPALQENRKDEFALGAIGRYVKLVCNAPATPYNYSIFEFELYGRAMAAGEPCEITVNAEDVKLQVDDTYAFTVTVKDCNGDVLPNANVQWTSTGGTITGGGFYTATSAGEFEVTASAGLVSATASVIVEYTPTVPPTEPPAIPVSVDETAEVNIYANSGRIYCDAENYKIYNLAGIDVSSRNGSLYGLYVVVVGDTVLKVRVN